MHRRALALLPLAGLLACAAQDPLRAPVAARSRGVEDALPALLAEDEVDVPARPLHSIEPEYPPSLRALGVEGDVEARVIVLADGTVGGARLVASTHPAFTEAARSALRAARFHPALHDGRVVPSWVGLRLHFRLGE